ncbi:hypothetical protein [Streptomyces stelliscabiei]|uniref:hypothetical protein n=1 Tax=Streptomyces stelliscabiei TaxID=146820 RepID=UPI0029B49AB7|nr:hypothetical protein [Streptomyces stelliscabiei]MDX2554714.1 hypothetical protein [Streptomyces stelliscabiei]MDX2613241.1 hypothetical protein [Streptomyces stelliscabiei]MDX2638483.1 hypothetical protein [Streptomyces stelliscabiei]MDX2661635.1 hypothetical protein [Streptomyces stelliscabiei]MDX2712232.1 hypothetical protein [Streptomyces stelliscabiei]
MSTATATAAVAVAERPTYPECRRSWMQEPEAPTCFAWITARAIFRAEQAELRADNALRSMTGNRSEVRYWAAHPEERNARHKALTSERDNAWTEIRTLLARRAECTCIGPDMPR